MQSVVFYNRGFTGKIALPQMPIVEKYSHHMLGGPDKAYLTMPQHADMWDLMKLLRCPVEIYGGDGRLDWWGYVNRIGIPHGDQRIGLGLDNLFNYVSMEYTGDVTTTPVSNAVSIAEFGQKEHKLFDSNATLAEATQAAALYLADHEYARPEVEFNGGNQDIKIECYGWYQSLDWKYYTTTDTSNVENTTQITSMVTSAGQFLRGTLVEHIAGITSSAVQDGSRTALACINELLNAGTTDVRPLLPTVDRNRYLHVYERTAEPAGNPDYMLRDDGNLVTPLNQVEPPEHCITAKWVKVKDVPISVLSTVAMRPFFIESAEYTAATDRTIYRPAAGYEQQRLAKYIDKTTYEKTINDYPPIIPGDTTGGGGGASGWAMMVFDNNTIDYEVSNGFSWTDESSGNVNIVSFSVPTAGFYLVGAMVANGSGGTGSTVSLTFDGFANYATNLESFITISASNTISKGISETLGDYLAAGTTIRVYGAWNSAVAYPANFYAWAVRLS